MNQRAGDWLLWERPSGRDRAGRVAGRSPLPQEERR